MGEQRVIGEAQVKASPTKREIAEQIVNQLYSDLPASFAVRFWDGKTVRYGEEPLFTLVFNDQDAFRRLLLFPDALTAGEAFIKKQIDIEGDIFGALRLKDHFENVNLTIAEKVKIFLRLLGM
jgi:cyclopropane-fatty-acyl-phospholipid synthase